MGAGTGAGREGGSVSEAETITLTVTVPVDRARLEKAATDAATHALGIAPPNTYGYREPGEAVRELRATAEAEVRRLVAAPEWADRVRAAVRETAPGVLQEAARAELRKRAARAIRQASDAELRRILGTEGDGHGE